MIQKIYIAVLLSIFILSNCKKDKEQPPAPEKRIMVSTIAGTGEFEYADGPALQAKFLRPWDVAVLPDGGLLVTDIADRRVRLIRQGQVTSFAGNGEFGIVNGKGAGAKFKEVSMLATDRIGNGYVLDGSHAQIRQVSRNADVSAFAGTGEFGFQDGPIALARLNQSWGILAEPDGSILFADTYNHRIRRVTNTGQVITVAGSGIGGYAEGPGNVARFNRPYGIARDAAGNIYVCDARNYCIRKIQADGTVSTVAGSGIEGRVDGKGPFAQFTRPYDMVIDSRGNLYITDESTIRRINPAGEVSTIAGNLHGFADGIGVDARFNNPIGLAIDGQDNIYVADAGNSRIRKISFE